MLDTIKNENNISGEKFYFEFKFQPWKMFVIYLQYDGSNKCWISENNFSYYFTFGIIISLFNTSDSALVIQYDKLVLVWLMKIIWWKHLTYFNDFISQPFSYIFIDAGLLYAMDMKGKKENKRILYCSPLKSSAELIMMVPYRVTSNVIIILVWIV